MLRRLGVVLALLFVLAPSAAAQFSDPGAGTDDPGTSGRTPRVPRSSMTGAPQESAAPGTSEARSETGATAPAPVGVARSRVRSHVDTDQRAIALTLDDGFRPDLRILELIRSYGVHGTAFIVGSVADSDPGLINELAQLGWLVCSHTYDHELLPGRSLEAIRRDMLRGIEAVERVVGYRCPYFRAPYGSVDANVVAVADELGVQLIGWEASISDSAPRGTDPDLQLSIAQRDVRPGSILLGHFGGTNSYEVLSRLLAWLGDEGYSVGSVAELIDGTTAPLAELGTSEVTVDLPGVGGAGALMPAQSTATHPWSLSAVETAIDVAGVAMILLLVRRRLRPRRRRRAAPAPQADAVVLHDTVPEWELAPVLTRPAPLFDVLLPRNGHHEPDRVPVTTEGWT
jgi:peptidoglycan/xylan/chitin deacetylase (PgdA/CDA1 family)